MREDLGETLPEQIIDVTAQIDLDDALRVFAEAKQPQGLSIAEPSNAPSHHSFSSSEGRKPLVPDRPDSFEHSASHHADQLLEHPGCETRSSGEQLLLPTGQEPLARETPDLASQPLSARKQDTDLRNEQAKPGPCCL